jgi:protein-S-isoprenylcysteine O-methyltransferase Ste14
MKFLFEKQILHLLSLLILLFVVFAVQIHVEEISDGDVWGISAKFWFWCTIFITIFHQIFVWFTWRTQLESQWITRWFPEHGFSIYLGLFFLFFIGRFLFFGFTAIANRGTMPLHNGFKWSLVILLSVPALWLFYSVKKYFGFKRAAGADHFFEIYRNMPLVKEGIFKYSNNGMYLFGFLAFWAIAVGLESKGALILAVFSHLYIWVHYYCTERPDMKRIYDGR